MPLWHVLCKDMYKYRSNPADLLSRIVQIFTAPTRQHEPLLQIIKYQEVIYRGTIYIMGLGTIDCLPEVRNVRIHKFCRVSTPSLP